VVGVNDTHTVQPGGEKKKTREMSTQTEEKIPTVTTSTQITTQTETQTNKRPAEQQSTDTQTKKKHMIEEGQAQYKQEGSESICSIGSINPSKTQNRNGEICLDEYLEYLVCCKPKNPTTVSTVAYRRKGKKK